jgi:AcrR family transcriptional regulator
MTVTVHDKVTVTSREWGLMEQGLRERKKARTMHHVQAVALKLFSERGFDEVTVEQVAAEAEVSPSTVYRYFGTKEGLVIVDEFDDPAIGGFEALLVTDEPLLVVLRRAFASIDEEQFGQARSLTMIRTKMILDTPALSAAAAIRIAELTVGLADHLAAARGFTRAKALALVATGMGCMVAALHEWYEADGAVSYSACLDEALDALSELHTI